MYRVCIFTFAVLVVVSMLKNRHMAVSDMIYILKSIALESNNKNETYKYSYTY